MRHCPCSHKQKRRHFHVKTTVHWWSTRGAEHIGDALTTAALRPFFRSYHPVLLLYSLLQYTPGYCLSKVLSTKLLLVLKPLLSPCVYPVRIKTATFFMKCENWLYISCIQQIVRKLINPVGEAHPGTIFFFLGLGISNTDCLCQQCE